MNGVTLFFILIGVFAVTSIPLRKRK